MGLALLAVIGRLLVVILVGTLWPAIAKIAAFGLVVSMMAGDVLRLAFALGDLVRWIRRRLRAR